MVFHKYALNNMGVDAIATGHYARTERTKSGKLVAMM